jgi:hypothetical protein
MTSLEIINSAKPEFQALIAINHPTMSKEAIQGMILNEISHYANIVSVKPDLNKCTKESVIAAIKQAIRKNLTLDPTAGLMYLTPRSVNVGNQQNKQWITVLEAKETVNGLISVALQSGAILDYSEPKIEYDGPNVLTAKVTKVSMQIQKPSGAWEVREFNEINFKKWMTASHRQGSRGKDDASTRNYANPLYFSQNGGIDQEFAKSKCIRHSLTRLGINMNNITANRIVVDAKPIIQVEVANQEVIEHAEVMENNDLNETAPTIVISAEPTSAIQPNTEFDANPTNIKNIEL